MRFRNFALGTAMLVIFALALTAISSPYHESQPNTPTTLTFDGTGSFEVEGNGDLTFEMDGSLLFNDVKGNVTVSSGLKKEYGPVTRKIGGKEVTRTGYHGKGTVTIKNGTFRAVMFFGRKTKGSFKGVGRFQFTGSGNYKIANEASQPWYEGGMTVYAPKLSSVPIAPKNEPEEKLAK